MSYVVFPTPRTYIPGEGSRVRRDVPLAASTDKDLSAQEFVLRATGDNVTLHAGGPLGERYGRSVWQQILDQAGDDIEPFEITDYPDFATRGVMLDISRSRVPTQDTLRRYLELLALARVNEFQLYTEHTFAFEGEEATWHDASPMTADDIRWLGELCSENGIELVPNQNTFGHLERFLATPKHAHRAEAPEGWYMGHEHVESAVIAPNDDNAAFVNSLIDQLLPLFPSRSINIGADETFELGQGVSKDAVAEHGLGRVYLDFVLKIMRPLIEKGYTVQYWADILAHYPELLDEMPEGSLPVVWMYEGKTSLHAASTSTSALNEATVEVGMALEDQLEGFEAAAKELIARDTAFWVAPGTSTWRSLIGRIQNARENMFDAARVGLEHGSTGFLNTLWGDHGMIEPPTTGFEPLLLGGAISWNAATAGDTDTTSVLSRWFYDDDTENLAGAAHTLAGLWNTLGVPSLNSSPLFDILMPHLHTISDLTSVTPEAITRVEQQIDDCINQLARATPRNADAAISIRELTHAASFARFAANELRANPGEAADRLRNLDDLITEQRACWLLRSRPGGLERSLNNLEPLRTKLAEAAEQAR
ncbi:family 20 glycosylhydrolase [Frigoribacterium faeni]|uniref:family 20 glycosylhydrolase n=1 Tax=Frigoribacterium faeni TaxID=145483 RepID=UPI0024132876|nr:family 20 glycosylhydrolase [Frigoribacterium faeni]